MPSGSESRGSSNLGFFGRQRVNTANKAGPALLLVGTAPLRTAAPSQGAWPCGCPQSHGEPLSSARHRSGLGCGSRTQRARNAELRGSPGNVPCLKSSHISDTNGKRPLKSFMIFCSPTSSPSFPSLLLAFYELLMRRGAQLPGPCSAAHGACAAPSPRWLHGPRLLTAATSICCPSGARRHSTKPRAAVPPGRAERRAPGTEEQAEAEGAAGAAAAWGAGAQPGPEGRAVAQLPGQRPGLR